jgi:hypothetical protein
MPGDAHALTLDDPAHYRVRIQGVFDTYGLELLSGVWVISCHQRTPNRVTTLIGQVADQAALMGALEQLYCLGLPLLSVEYLVENDKTKCSEGQKFGKVTAAQALKGDWGITLL